MNPNKPESFDLDFVPAAIKLASSNPSSETSPLASRTLRANPLRTGKLAYAIFGRSNNLQKVSVALSTSPISLIAL